MKNLSQRAAAFVQQLETRGTTIDMAGIEALLRDVAAARDFELVAKVKRWVNSSIIDSTGCKIRWEDLPDGTPLYAAPPVPKAGQDEGPAL